VDCDDGVDNDGDGLTDFRPDGSGDPGCSDLRDQDERGSGPGSLQQSLQVSQVPLPAPGGAGPQTARRR
jgi:hypothetical protein